MDVTRLSCAWNAGHQTEILTIACIKEDQLELGLRGLRVRLMVDFVFCFSGTNEREEQRQSAGQHLPAFVLGRSAG